MKPFSIAALAALCVAPLAAVPADAADPGHHGYGRPQVRYTSPLGYTRLGLEPASVRFDQWMNYPAAHDYHWRARLSSRDVATIRQAYHGHDPLVYDGPAYHPGAVYGDHACGCDDHGCTADCGHGDCGRRRGKLGGLFYRLLHKRRWRCGSGVCCDWYRAPDCCDTCCDDSCRSHKRGLFKRCGGGLVKRCGGLFDKLLGGCRKHHGPCHDDCGCASDAFYGGGHEVWTEGDAYDVYEVPEEGSPHPAEDVPALPLEEEGNAT